MRFLFGKWGGLGIVRSINPSWFLVHFEDIIYVLDTEFRIISCKGNLGTVSSADIWSALKIEAFHWSLLGKTPDFHSFIVGNRHQTRRLHVGNVIYIFNEVVMLANVENLSIN